MKYMHESRSKNTAEKHESLSKTLQKLLALYNNKKIKNKISLQHLSVYRIEGRIKNNTHGFSQRVLHGEGTKFPRSPSKAPGTPVGPNTITSGLLSLRCKKCKENQDLISKKHTDSELNTFLLFFH